MSQQGLTPEFAIGYRDLMLDGFKNEAEVTKKVIAAVPDAASSYKPDPHARTAKELAWHLAGSDVHFLESILNLKFTCLAAQSRSLPPSPKSSHGTIKTCSPP